MDKTFLELYDDIKKDKLKVVYQPKFNIKTNEVVGLESLIRWQDKNNGIIDTEKFIEKLEVIGAIYLIDYYMIENAFKLVRQMTLKNMKIVPISVNVSKSTILRYDFLDKIVELLDKYKVLAKYIEFEITEREVFNDIENLSKTISLLRSFGIKISIDDFGIGYSSLFAISSLDFDILKIDKSIINKIGKNEKIDSILKGIKNIMDEINILIVAEGIESEEQHLKLLEYGYEYAQGYYFSKPREIENLNIICIEN